MTTRVSIGPGGVEGNNDSGFIFSPAISADGRFVVFESIASNLVAGDTDDDFVLDVFVHDLQTGLTTRVSVGAGGIRANDSSRAPAISGDGRFVAFESVASNLVAGDTNEDFDVFVHDRFTGVTTRVSVATGGTQGEFASHGASISADGRWVSFYSASTFVAGDTNETADVFVHDRETGLTTRVSVGSGGTQSKGPATAPGISADGRWIAFQSWASNLVAGDTNVANDIFIHDRLTGATWCVSVGPGGVPGNGPSINPAMSADGRWIAFSSHASSLIFDDTNSDSDVFVHDRTTGTTTRVSLGPGGAQALGYSGGASISADGRWVGFGSLSHDLVPGDTSVEPDVFVHDRQTGTTTRVSVATGGVQANDSSRGGSVSADGRVAFASVATNLVADDTNDRSDVFVYDPGDALCVWAVAPTSTLVPAAGGSGRLVVVAPASCGWAVATSAPSWLTTTGASTGTGVGTVDYRVAPNTGAPRGGTLTVDGAVFSLGQAGVLTPEAPAGLVVHSVIGTRVTLYWTAPASGPRPTGFVLEGGVRPGEALVRVPTGSTAPAFAFDAPAGSFYARVRALNGVAESAASNEVRIHVNVPVVPSPPAGLIGLVDGATVSLTWTNTFAGGAPTSIVLEVSGAAVARIPLGLVDHTAFAGVRGGIYHVAVRAVNGSGASERSSTLTLTVPASCPGPPAVPVDMRAYRTGNTVTVSWAPDTEGTAPTSYVLIVTGSLLASCATTERSVSAEAGPGTYILSVVAVNACGVSAGTPVQSLVVP